MKRAWRFMLSVDQALQPDFGRLGFADALHAHFRQFCRHAVEVQRLEAPGQFCQHDAPPRGCHNARSRPWARWPVPVKGETLSRLRPLTMAFRDAVTMLSSMPTP